MVTEMSVPREHRVWPLQHWYFGGRVDSCCMSFVVCTFIARGARLITLAICLSLWSSRSEYPISGPQGWLAAQAQAGRPAVFPFTGPKAPAGPRRRGRAGHEPRASFRRWRQGLQKPKQRPGGRNGGLLVSFANSNRRVTNSPVSAKRGSA